MDKENKERFWKKSLPAAITVFWAFFSLITAVHCWNYPESPFITVSSLLSLAGSIYFTVKTCKELTK